MGETEDSKSKEEIPEEKGREIVNPNESVDLDRLRELQKGLELRKFETWPEKDENGKERELAYPDTQAGKNDAKEIRAILEKHRGEALFEDQVAKWQAELKARGAQIQGKWLAHEFRKAVELEFEIEEAKKKPPKKLDPESGAVIIYLSPEERARKEKLYQESIEREREKDQKEKSKKPWWKFW